MGGERREGAGAGGGFLRQSERMRFAIYCYDQAKKRRQALSCVRIVVISSASGNREVIELEQLQQQTRQAQ